MIAEILLYYSIRGAQRKPWEVMLLLIYYKWKVKMSQAEMCPPGRYMTIQHSFGIRPVLDSLTEDCTWQCYLLTQENGCCDCYHQITWNNVSKENLYKKHLIISEVEDNESLYFCFCWIQIQQSLRYENDVF